jgi:hypothetical protein
MKSLIASLFIATSASAAETMMFPVQDLLHDVPSFVADHTFSVSGSLNGRFVPPDSPREIRKTRRQMEAELIDLMWEFYPDAVSIRIWRGNLIVRMP